MAAAHGPAEMPAEARLGPPVTQAVPPARSATNGSGPLAGGGRVEIQLRARERELEARLADVTRCLEAAETRASELLAMTARAERAELELDEAMRSMVSVSEMLSMTARAERAEREFAVLAGSKSWRLTRPLRRAMERMRRAGGRPVVK